MSRTRHSICVTLAARSRVALVRAPTVAPSAFLHSKELHLLPEMRHLAYIPHKKEYMWKKERKKEKVQRSSFFTTHRVALLSYMQSVEAAANPGIVGYYVMLLI